MYMLIDRETGLPEFGQYFRTWPFWLTRRICTCSVQLGKGEVYGPYPKMIHGRPGAPQHMTICSVCNKPRVHHLMRCQLFDCRQIFLKCFQHPRFDPMFPMCWDCLEKDGLPNWRTPLPPQLSDWKIREPSSEPFDYTSEVPTFTLEF